jgi:hypothetical protein
MSDFHIFRIPHSNFRIPKCLTPETFFFLFCDYILQQFSGE